ncbi:uncharacterized protein LOC110702143 [Chenopodium quinoa]|nr:uncharacterized protein LOC110702143 [Chenopodium quinoa]
MAKMVSTTTFCVSSFNSKPRKSILISSKGKGAAPLLFPASFLSPHKSQRRPISLQSKAFGKSTSTPKTDNDKTQKQEIEQDEEIEVEEDLPWIQEKALDLVEFTGSVSQAIPGPRVGQTSFPWFLAVPLAVLGITFVTSFLKALNKFTSPREKRRKLVRKNATLNKSIDELFEKGRDAVQYSALEDIVKKTGFSMEDVLRKYLRYAFNDKPFNGDTVADLIQLRKASMLSDSQVAEILNDVSRRIVKDKGPVVMDASGYTERGFKRKLAVQALFGKVFYLSELSEFCARDNSLIVKEIFGVTDEDADKLRIDTLSHSGDIEALEKMIEDGSDSEDNDESSE